MEVYVLPTIAQFATIAIMFDLWMFRIGFDTFMFIINFTNDNCVPYHVILRLFKTLNTFWATLTKQLKSLLVEYQFTNKIIAYVKDKGTNLNTQVLLHWQVLYFVHCCNFLQPLLAYVLVM